jgi:hypothetical protein
MAPFSPKGDRSQRTIVAELAANADYGDELTYARLGRALGLDGDDDRAQIRQAVAAARDLLTLDHNRALIAVRGKGYRVARPGEHAGLAQQHRRKADRQITRALAVVTHVDESAMTPDELRRNRAVALLIGNLASRMTSAETRLQQLENAVFGDGPQVIQGKVEDA